MKGTQRTVRRLRKMKSDLQVHPYHEVLQQVNLIRLKQRGRLRAGFRGGTVASGSLLSGLNVDGFGDADGQHIRLQSQAPHSGYVEYGTGDYQSFNPAHAYYGVGQQYRAPLFPVRILVAQIKQWMRLRGIIPLTGSLDQSAFLIAQEISRFNVHPTEGVIRTETAGTPAQPFFWMPIMTSEHDIRRAFRRGVRRSMP